MTRRISNPRSTALFIACATQFMAPWAGAQVAPLPSAASRLTDPVAQPRDASAELEREIDALQSRPNGLTARRAAELASAVSFDLAAAEQRRLAADADVEVAKMRYAPRLNLSAGYTRLSAIDPPALGTLVAAPGAAPRQPIGPGQPLIAVPLSFPVLLNQTTLRAQLVVPLSDYFVRFPQVLDAAKEGRGAAQQNVVAQRAKSAAEAQIAYYSWARAVLQHVTVQQSKERANEHLRDTQRLFEAGLAINADVRSIEAQVAQAELLETRAANAEAITAEQLRLQLQLPLNAPIEIGERLTDIPVLPSQISLQAAWTEAQAKRPELVALGQTERQLLHQSDVTWGGELPRVDAFGEVVTANPNSRYQPMVDAFKTTWAVGVQASWTVNDWPTNAAARRGLLAQARAVAAQGNGLREALRGEIVASQRGVAQAKATIASAQRGMKAADVAYRVRKDLYLSGRARSVELTDAETDLTRARIEYIDALIDARIAAVRLAHALGRDAGTTDGGTI